MTTISAQSLDLTFPSPDGPVHALSDISLDIEEGEFVSFIGPSGCGKTTFLRCVVALETPALTMGGMTPDEARKARAYGYVFQAAGLYPWRTIGRNVTLPLEIMFGRLKDWRRDAPRDDRSPTVVSSGNALAAPVRFWLRGRSRAKG